MLTKNDISNELNAFSKATGIPVMSMLVLAGGSMVLQGQRPTTGDIDVVVTMPDLRRIMDLKTQGVIQGEFVTEDEVLLQVGNLSLGASPLDRGRTMVNGFKVTGNEENLKFYLGLNRPKDQPWIRLLQTLVG